jgi:serine/threonine-protein kinase
MDTMVADNLIGSLVDGRYRVRSRVARGGMATVYTAVDERLERTVALKIIHPGQANDPRFVDRFTREAKTIARLTHPNVVAVYDQGRHDGMPYLIMEYVRGRTLRDILTDSPRMSPSDALAVMEQMLAAIAAAHRSGVVHRDVKPENVLIAEAPGSRSLVDAVVKVADFGLARAVEASADDGDGQLLATVAYVAPELVTEGRANPRSDVYSVGIVLFEMLTGRVPYDGGKPIEIAWQHVDEDVPAPSRSVPGLPSEIDDLVRLATNRNPDRRPADAGAMLAAVQGAQDSIEANASRSAASHSLAAPTVQVDTIKATAGSTDRPSWARLPSNRAEERQVSGRRRAATTGRAATRRGPGIAGSPAAIWFAQFMSRPKGRRTFYATLAVLAVLIAFTGWYFGFGRYTTAPSLLGQTKSQAVALAQHDGFTVRFAAPVFSATAKADSVIAQSPQPNGKILKDGVVTLTLSKGPEVYKIGNEVGATFDDADADLRSIKMSIKRVDAYNDDIPTGYVVSTNPAAGTIEPPNTVVTVTVSKGRAPITVPNVVGQDFNTANATLTGLGLQVAEVQKASTTVLAGTVMQQSLQDGSGAAKNQTIILTVSTGPPVVAVPDVTNQGLTFDQASQILQKAGFTAVNVFDFPGGQVRNQSPVAGTMAPEGTQVQIWMGP